MRTALDRTIQPDPALAAAAEALSAAYRAGAPPPGPGRFVHDDRTAAGYAAVRMPATLVAIGRAMIEGARSLPGFAPRRLLDVGAGTGAATWAARAIWPSLDDLVLIDREPVMVALGRRLATAAGDAPLTGADWRVAKAGLEAGALPEADLVVTGYLLGELDPAVAERLVSAAWAASRGAVVIVEPGSRAGFARILAAREVLMAAGAAIVAPCPGNVPCPIRDPAWCHFLARLERSPLHRATKAAFRSWEDEPYSYVVAARPADAPAGDAAPRDPAAAPRDPGAPDAHDPAPRIVLGRPRHLPGRVQLRVCTTDGLVTPTISRRHGPAWQVARDLEWGDRVSSVVADQLAANDRADLPASSRVEDEPGHPPAAS